MAEPAAAEPSADTTPAAAPEAAAPEAAAPEAAAAAPEATAAVPLRKPLPLLKFEESGRARLCPEGIEAIAALPGPVLPIAFVGDGRSGKSFLASRVAGVEGEAMFQQDDSDVAVTEGIDAMVVGHHPGHLVVLDCEGGNNALSKSHSIVTVVGALLATALVFVTDGKASEAAIEALSYMLQERALIKCEGSGTLQSQHLMFVVNQNRLRYQEDTLEKILAAKHDQERVDLRELISSAYPEGWRHFFTVPADHKEEFTEKMEALHGAILESVEPLKMGKLWMTGEQAAGMLRQVEAELRTHGKVSLPSLHRHVVLDSWLRPVAGQALATRLDKLVEESGMMLQQNGVGKLVGTCTDCKKEGIGGWNDPDTDDFYCEDCWRRFSPKVLKCGFCSAFRPWPCGRVETVTKHWHCMDCLMQLGIDFDDDDE